MQKRCSGVTVGLATAARFAAGFFGTAAFLVATAAAFAGAAVFAATGFFTVVFALAVVFAALDDVVFFAVLEAVAMIFLQVKSRTISHQIFELSIVQFFKSNAGSWHYDETRAPCLLGL
jgi:hypothetical protein